MSDPLDHAFRELRASADGRSPEAEHTLRRVLADAGTRSARRLPSAVRWLPIAAVLAVSSAWAGLGSDRVQGLFAPAGVIEEHEPSAAPPERAAYVVPRVAPSLAAAEGEPAAVAHDQRGTTAVVAPSVAVAPKAPLPRAAPAPVAAPAPSAVTTAPPAAVEAPAHDALAADARDFKRAFALHVSGAPSAAVAAWSDYLAAHPNGRFVPEARYSRAVDLLRAGRRGEAALALRPFAEAPPGGYRRADAQQLLRSITAQ